MTPSESPRPGLLRRVAAMVYDGLLLLGLELIAGLWLPAIPESLRLSATGRLLIFVWMLLVAFVFLGYCWTHGGQTLGMRAWKIRLIDDAGSVPGWGAALRRYVGAIASLIPVGLGFLAILPDAQNRAWHDRWSKTWIVFDDRYLEKQAATTSQAAAENQ